MSGRLHVLTVEDQALVSLLSQTALEQSGCEVTAVASGREAIAAIAAQSFDVALVNLGLPDIEGASLVRWIKQVAPTTGIVVSTGYPNSGPLAVSRQLPADVPVIEKPWSLLDLLDTVKRVACSSTN